MQPLANVLQIRCSYKFPNVHKKISVLESLFNKVTLEARIVGGAGIIGGIGHCNNY